MKRVCMHGYISGRVQGVHFRQSTVLQAQSLDLDGWVRNLADGRVEVLFEGDESNVSQLAEWLVKGPEQAEVTQLDLRPQPLHGLSGFELRR